MEFESTSSSVGYNVRVRARPNRERFSGVARITALLRAVVTARGEARSLPNVAPWFAQLTVFNGGVLRWQESSLGSTIPEEVLVEGYTSQFRVPLVNPRRENDVVLTDLPPWVERTRSRHFPRSKVSLSALASLGWKTGLNVQILEVSLNSCVVATEHKLDVAVG
jgi:hypothetical protein